MRGEKHMTWTAPLHRVEARLAVAGSPAIGLPAAPPVGDTVPIGRDERIYARLSRLMDVVLSILALIVFSPILFAAMLAIRLTSRGPVIFRQQRAGRDRVPFAMYKRRTMYQGADGDKELFRGSHALATGPCLQTRDDPRAPTAGR